jgi:signal transduction histidine kinase/ligand-binding sensor domain-containing protein/DNA-binding response OmpR family regulator
MKRLLILAMVFLFAEPLLAQNVNVINLKKGLSNNFVECMLQDKQGYVWIGTRDGLNLYNGNEVEIFREQLPSAFIYSLFQNSRGEIWIGMMQGGLSIYDPEHESFTTLSVQPHFSLLADKDVYAIQEDSLHNTWVGTLQGLGKIPPSRDTLYWFEQRSDNFVQAFTSIHESKNKSIWAGSNRGLYHLPKNVGSLSVSAADQEALLQNVFIRDIAEDKTGNLWLATDESGVLKFEPGSHKVTVYPTALQYGKHLQVWNVFIDSKGTVWAAVINGGVFRFDDVKNKFVTYRQHFAAQFNATSVSAIMEDFNGNLWIASHGDGVCYLNPDKYVFEKALAGETSHEDKRPLVVSSFLEDQTGTIWIGTDGNGLKHIEQGREIDNSFTVKNGLSSDIVLDILEDKYHGKWLATWQGGVDYIDPVGKKVSVFSPNSNDPFALKNPNVKSLMIDSASNIWMVSHGNGVAVYNIPDRKFIDPATLTPAFRPEVAQWGSDILQSQNGDIWIASHAGLFRYSGSSVQHYFAGALSSSLIYCLYEDASGSIWVGTSSSLEKFIPEKNAFENYTKLYNIPGNVKCVQEDARHRLWISTIHEIVMFDRVSKKVRHFDENYNAQRGQFYECACMKTSSGKLYFGGTEGYNSFWPDSIQESLPASSLLIKDLYIFNKKQVPGEHDVLKKSMSFTTELDLSHDQNVVSFEFQSINYSTFNRQYYSYKMEGFNQDWTPAAEGRIATYTNLDPGHYVFRVRSLSVDGNVTGEASVKINIIPPFWKTTWFTVVSILMLVVFSIGYLLLRLYGSKQKRLMLQRVVADRTREISEKNILLEEQTRDLQAKNHALQEQDAMIREQASTLERQRDQLQQNNVVLQDLVSTKNRLFSIIAHDLRNPFTSLLGFAKLLNTEYHRFPDQERQKLIRSLHHSSTSIYSLLDNLLIWSKSQQHELVFEPEQLAFRTFVEEHFELIRDEAEKKNVTLHLSAHNELAFSADRNMLSIILRNLLSNALKYSPVNGKIEVGYTLENEVPGIFVKDEGLGVDDPEALFHVHTEVHRQRDHNHGLGLILCKEFVEKHGGNLSVRNNPEKGACFLFTLPNSRASVVKSNNAPIEFHEHEQLNGSAKQDSSLPTVLIAEDDDDIRWYIRQTLAADFNVLEAVNGSEACGIALDKMPDTIISDMNMPGMSGVEFCVKMKGNRLTSHIPFILLTAERGNDKKVSGFQHGADDYITKPVDAEVLKARLFNLLETRKKLKAIYQSDITSAPESFTSNPLDQEFIQKLNTIIETRIADSDLNPDTLAQHMHMSRTGLYMKVKALTGESVSIYVRNIRLKESRKLLRNGKINVSEVAYAVGFNQLPYFTTCFKEAFGVTPSEFMSTQKI